MITVGKHGRNAHIGVLANALSGLPMGLAVPFQNSGKSFSGMPGQRNDLGRLSADWQRIYRATDVVYTVLSYGTPIGWQDNKGQWTVPSESYSATTSGHQSKLHYALHYNGMLPTETLPASA